MSTIPPPSPPETPKHVNLGTMMSPSLASWRAKVASRALSAKEAYAIAVDADRARERQLEIGYRLYWPTRG